MGLNNSKEQEVNYLLECLPNHEKEISCMAISQDKSLIATGSEDCNILIWSTISDETECLGILKGHTSYITSLAICDVSVLSGSDDATVRKWDVTTCECLYIFEGHKSRINKLICNGDFILSTSYDTTAIAWNFNADEEFEEDGDPGSIIKQFEGHCKAVNSILLILSDLHCEEDEDHINPGDIVITGSSDQTAKKWCFQTGSCLQTYVGHKGVINCISSDSEGRILYTGSEDTTIRSWDILTGKCLMIMEGGHIKPVLCMVVHDRMLYSGSQDGTVGCWIKQFGDKTKTIKGHKHSVTSIKFVNGILYTASGDGHLRAFDPKSGNLKRIFLGHEELVSCFTIVGEKLYSGSRDATLRVWDISSITECAKDEEGTKKLKKFEDRQKQTYDELDKQLDSRLPSASSASKVC